MIQALYSTDLWPALADALDDAQHGDGDGLLALSDTYLERDDDGTWTNTIEAFVAISCLDDPVPTRHRLRTPTWPTSSKRSRRDSAARSHRATSARCGRCDSQPGPPATGAGAPPIVVVGTTGDPFTPLEQTAAARRRARERRAARCARARATPATARTAASTTSIDDYLIDLTVPADGTRC